MSRLQAQTVGLVGSAAPSSRHSDRDYYGKRERLYSAVVESSNDAIITKSLDGIITGWNKAAEHLFGYSAAEAIGQPIDIIVPEDRKAEVERYPEPRQPQAKSIAQHETVRLHKDGRAIDVLAERLSAAIGRRQDHRRLQDRPRHHRREADEKTLRREIEERQRIFETSQDLILVTDGYRQFHPGQPEREDHSRLEPGRHDRAQRHRVHSSR